MYLVNYDLYDMYALFLFFRVKPERFLFYKPAAQEIAEYINKPAENNSADTNNIRKILKKYYDESDEMLSWVVVENKYTANIGIIKNKAAYEILLKIFDELKENHNEPERFKLLCDAVHNIPLILADETKPKKAINAMIKDYRKRYNSLFLKEELKMANWRKD